MDYRALVQKLGDRTNQNSQTSELILEHRTGHPSCKPKVIAKRGFSMVGYTKMDLGIAKLHFEIGAGNENFKWVVKKG